MRVLRMRTSPILGRGDPGTKDLAGPTPFRKDVNIRDVNPKHARVATMDGISESASSTPHQLSIVI